MKCPFCERPVKLNRYMLKADSLDKIYISFQCAEPSCWVDGEFPRYMGLFNDKGEWLSQEYALGTFYAKVYPTGTCIYRMMSCMLMDEVKIPRALWLNLTNTDATLDKIRTLIIFS